MIDEQAIYYFLVKEIGMSPCNDMDDYIDDMGFKKFGWLWDAHHDRQREFFETMASTISVGYARTQTKKKIDLFEPSTVKSNGGVSKITQEQHNDELTALQDRFGGWSD